MNGIEPWLPSIAGFMLAAVSLPMSLGRVPPNRWYGARLPIAFRSREDWYAINRATGRVGTIAGVLAGIGSAAAAALPGTTDLRIGISVALLTAAAIAMAITARIVARQRKTMPVR